MKFIVEVRPPLPEDLAVVAEKLAEAFNISSAKANGLLRRAPGPVTKPVSEREASVVAGIFESAGLSVTTSPEADVLASNGAARVHGDLGRTPPADVAGYVAGDAREAEIPASAPAATDPGDDTTAEVNAHAAGIEDADLAVADDGEAPALADEGDDLELLVDRDSGADSDLRRKGDAGAEASEQGGRGSDGGAIAAGVSPDDGFGYGGGMVDDGRDDGSDDGYLRLGEAAAASTVMEPLRDDGLDDEGLDDDGLSLDDATVDDVAVDGPVVDRPLTDHPVVDGLGVDDLDRDRLDRHDPERDDFGVDDLAVDQLGVDVRGVDVRGVDGGGVDDLGLDDLGVATAGVDDDGIEGAIASDVAAAADGVGTEAELGHVWGGIDGETEGTDGYADRGQGSGSGVPDGALMAGAAAAASGWAGAVRDSEGAPDEQAGSEQAAAVATDSDGEPSVSPSGTAPVYRSGVRELQRHGGTTAAELGMHARNATQREATPSGVRRRIVAVGIWPALLTLLVVVVGAALTLLPVIRGQQAAAADRTAAAVASSVEGVSAGLPLAAPIVNAVLSDIAGRSQARLVGQGVDYLVITDDQGLPLAGWYRGAATLTNLPPDVGRDVATAATAVAATDAGVAPGETLMQSLAASWRDVLAMVGLGSFETRIGSAAVRDGANLVGTVVVGMDPAPLWSATGSALLTMLLLGLIPVLIGIFAAMALARRVTGGLRYLLDAADSISRGDLEHAVQLDSKDELGQLARAIERMRVSLQEGLERLRRRR